MEKRYYVKEIKHKYNHEPFGFYYEQQLWLGREKLYYRFTCKSERSPITGKDGYKFVREHMIKQYELTK